MATKKRSCSIAYNEDGKLMAIIIVIKTPFKMNFHMVIDISSPCTYMARRMQPGEWWTEHGGVWRNNCTESLTKMVAKR